MLIGGVLGFFIISAFWIIPGIIMIIGGLLTFKKPKVMQTRVEEGQGVV
jgi:paraquat-inducible protein B